MNESQAQMRTGNWELMSHVLLSCADIQAPQIAPMANESVSHFGVSGPMRAGRFKCQMLGAEVYFPSPRVWRKSEIVARTISIQNCLVTPTRKWIPLRESMVFQSGGPRKSAECLREGLSKQSQFEQSSWPFARAIG
jgi:hypothetical protein